MPLGSGFWKYYNSPLDSFWCCTGTGVEEFAKFADSIYFHDDGGIFVNLFIPSELNWAEKGVHLRQETKFPEHEGTSLTIHSDRPVEMTLNIRVPYWATRGGAVKLNGAALPAFSSPSSYLSIYRTWKDGDKVEVSLPMSLHIHPMPDDPTLQAMMYGPLVLAARLGDKGLTDALTYPKYDTAPAGEQIPVSAVINPSKVATGWAEPVAGTPLNFRTTGQDEAMNFIPLYKVSGERYAVYLKVGAKAL